MAAEPEPGVERSSARPLHAFVDYDALVRPRLNYVDIPDNVIRMMRRLLNDRQDERLSTLPVCQNYREHKQPPSLLT
jgi:hypothetical protein